MNLEIALWSIKHLNQERILDPFGAELLASRFLTRLGIGCATEFRLASYQAAFAADPAEWVKKEITSNGRAKFSATVGDMNLLVRRIPGVISVYGLRRLFGVEAPRNPWTYESTSDADANREIREYLHRSEDVLFTGGEGSERHSFVDFVLSDDMRPIMAAIDPNGSQMLEIHAARLFLGTTAAHAGNLLVDSAGKLFSIDHELVMRKDVSAFYMLKKYVSRNSIAWAALRPIAQLHESDIEQSFEGLPGGITWPMGSLEVTRAYYQTRLRYWKAIFGVN